MNDNNRIAQIIATQRHLATIQPSAAELAKAFAELNASLQSGEFDLSQFQPSSLRKAMGKRGYQRLRGKLKALCRAL